MCKSAYVIYIDVFITLEDFNNIHCIGVNVTDKLTNVSELPYQITLETLYYMYTDFEMQIKVSI